MTEFTNGIYKTLEKLTESSFSLAITYTIGHILIAVNVVYFMTGASLFEAGLVALVEPFINGLWFYFLHKMWKKVKGIK